MLQQTEFEPYKDYHAVVCEMDMSDFVNISRPRTCAQLICVRIPLLVCLGFVKLGILELVSGPRPQA